MSIIVQIKRRAVGGAAGAPATLRTAELAYNPNDGLFYVGYGDNGAGVATSIKAFARDNYNPSISYQEADADLTAISALAGTGFAVRTAGNTWAQRTLTGTAGRVVIANGDGITGNPSFDLATVAVGGVVAGGYTKFTVDGYGRVSNAGQAALSDLSAAAADVSLGNFKITNLATPTSNNDAATKGYVDSAVAGLLDFKGSIACAANPNYPAASKGDAYYVSSAGKIGGAAGKNVDIGDVVVASADNAGGTEAAVGASWFVLEHNLSGMLTASNNLSELTDPGAARTNLGLVIGTHVQGYNGRLDSISSAIVTTADNIFLYGASNSVTVYAVGATGKSLIAAANQAAARTTLGLTPGTDVLAYSARIQAAAGLAISSSDNVILYGAGNTAVAFQLGAVGKSIMQSANAGAGQNALGLTIGTHVQAFSSKLSNISALAASGAGLDAFLYINDAGVISSLASTATGRALFAAADQAAGRTALGLGTMAPQNANNVAITGGSIDNVVFDGGTF